MFAHKDDIIWLVVLTLFLLAWNIFLFVFGPSEFVALIGVLNALAVVALVSALGNSSLMTALLTVVTMAGLVTAGISPILLGLAAGIGVAFSDLIYLQQLYREEMSKADERSWKYSLSEWMTKRSGWRLPFLVYVYYSLSPLSSQTLMQALRVAKQPLSRVMLPVVLGSITLMLVVSSVFYFLDAQVFYSGSLAWMIR